MLHRIVIGLDASDADMATLRIVAGWAAQWRAEISGVFVEDINLLHLSGYAFAREFSSSFARERPITASDIERRWRAYAAQAQTLLRKLAQSFAIESSFTVVRGSSLFGATDAVGAADLIVMARSSAWRDVSYLGCEIRKLALAAPSAVLFAGDNAAADDRAAPVVCIIDGERGATRELPFAVKIGMAEQRRLLVMLVGNEKSNATSPIADALAEYPYGVDIMPIAPLDVTRLRHLRCSMVVMPARLFSADERALWAWARSFPQPLLVTK